MLIACMTRVKEGAFSGLEQDNKRNKDFISGIFKHLSFKGKYLCDHPANVARIRGQKNGVGLFGEIRERRYVLLGHAQ